MFELIKRILFGDQTKSIEFDRRPVISQPTHVFLPPPPKPDKKITAKPFITFSRHPVTYSPTTKVNDDSPPPPTLPPRMPRPPTAGLRPLRSSNRPSSLDINDRLTTSCEVEYTSKYSLKHVSSSSLAQRRIRSGRPARYPPQLPGIRGLITEPGKQLSLPRKQFEPPLTKDGVSADCKVCYERPFNAVTVPCNHMSMCYHCAIIIWLTKGECPICRQTIEKVIKTFWP